MAVLELNTLFVNAVLKAACGDLPVGVQGNDGDTSKFIKIGTDGQDLYMSHFSLLRLLQRAPQGGHCKQMVLDGEAVTKLEEELNRSFCPRSSTFYRFVASPNGDLSALVRRPTVFRAGIHRAVSGWTDKPVVIDKSVSVFVHCFSELSSGSQARSEALCLSAAMVLAYSGVSVTLHVPENPKFSFQAPCNLPLKVTPFSPRDCKVEDTVKALPDEVDGAAMLERLKAEKILSRNMKYNCNITKIKVRSADHWTDEALCAVGMSSSLLRLKDDAVVHVLDQRKSLFAEKAILLSTSVTQSLHEASPLHHMALHGGLRCAQAGGPGVKFEELLLARRKQVVRAFAIKYGDKAKDGSLEDLVQHMTIGTLRFELLAADSKSPVRVVCDGDSDDAFHKSSGCFVLYNYARVATVLSKFENAVAKGTYAPLPAIEDVDFSLLKDEKEWSLLFRYLIQLPALLDEMIQSVFNDSLQIALGTRKLCQFLSSLASEFSTYYSKVRILLEPLPHLFGLVHARIYLCKSIKAVFHRGLELLGIKPLEQI